MLIPQPCLIRSGIAEVDSRRSSAVKALEGRQPVKQTSMLPFTCQGRVNLPDNLSCKSDSLGDRNDVMTLHDTLSGKNTARLHEQCQD